MPSYLQFNFLLTLTCSRIPEETSLMFEPIQIWKDLVYFQTLLTGCSQSHIWLLVPDICLVSTQPTVEIIIMSSVVNSGILLGNSFWMNALNSGMLYTAAAVIPLVGRFEHECKYSRN